MTGDAATLAALNNAEWCDTIAAAHGSSGRFEAGFWINPCSAPPFYPNLVTLDLDATTTQRTAIASLAANRTGGFGVKDSFARLDLSDIGFEIAFSADWIWLGAETALSPIEPGLEVAIVNDPDGLAAWERAWGGEESQPLFPPTLLRDERIAFLSVLHAGEVLAGAALNRSAAALGLSNIFFRPNSDDRACLAALVAAARALHPALPIVGYEQADTLPLFLESGFERIGPLRVWVR